MTTTTRSRGRAGDPQRLCLDCPSAAPGRRPRPAPYPGPRCLEHHRQVKREAAVRKHDLYIARTYRGMAPGDYARIWEHQGGRCAICGRTLHTTKRGALEHDHVLNWPFGICCAVCNDYLGYIGRRLEVAIALAMYLVNPPAWAVIGPPPELSEAPF